MILDDNGEFELRFRTSPLPDPTFRQDLQRWSGQIGLSWARSSVPLATRKHPFSSTATTKGEHWLQRKIQTPTERKNQNDNRRPCTVKESGARFRAQSSPRNEAPQMYAMTPQAEIVLARLARAMFVKRETEGRKDGDGKSPSAHKEFFGIIEALSKAGCNILQARPNESPPLPGLGLNPLTGQPLPPPKGTDERTLLRSATLNFCAYLIGWRKSPYKTSTKCARPKPSERQWRNSNMPNTRIANPWRRGDQTAMAELFKRDPLLASILPAEAKPVELNLFGHNAI